MIGNERRPGESSSMMWTGAAIDAIVLTLAVLIAITLWVTARQPPTNPIAPQDR